MNTLTTLLAGFGCCMSCCCCSYTHIEHVRYMERHYQDWRRDDHEALLLPPTSGTVLITNGRRTTITTVHADRPNLSLSLIFHFSLTQKGWQHHERGTSTSNGGRHCGSEMTNEYRQMVHSHNRKEQIQNWASNRSQHDTYPTSLK